MANKRLFQFLYSKQPKLSMISGLVTFGASGAVSSAAGAGVQGVTKLATGIYKIKLQDNWYAEIDADLSMLSGVTGANVAAASLVTGTLYQITAVGTTNWAAVGLDSDVTAAIGQQFVATGVGTGTGTAKAIAASGILAGEIVQNPQSMLKNNNTSLGRGSILHIQLLDAAGALADPASGSQLSFKLWFRDSSVTAI